MLSVTRRTAAASTPCARQAHEVRAPRHRDHLPRRLNWCRGDAGRRFTIDSALPDVFGGVFRSTAARERRPRCAVGRPCAVATAPTHDPVARKIVRTIAAMASRVPWNTVATRLRTKCTRCRHRLTNRGHPPGRQRRPGPELIVAHHCGVRPCQVRPVCVPLDDRAPRSPEMRSYSETPVAPAGTCRGGRGLGELLANLLATCRPSPRPCCCGTSPGSTAPMPP